MAGFCATPRRASVSSRFGENPAAAARAGLIDVRATMRNTFLVSGALAGLAGAIEVLGVTFALYEDISPGYGYTAIAVALLAGLDPWKVLGSALLLAALEAGAGAMQHPPRLESRSTGDQSAAA